MLKEHEPPQESASEKAARRWKNAEVRNRLRQAQQKPKLVDPNNEPEIAETITNDGRIDGPLNRFESKFKKEIRQMMEGYSQQNLAFYKAAIEHRRYILLKEKLSRLKLAQAMEEVSK
jgi:hypothetical protein